MSEPALPHLRTLAHLGDAVFSLWVRHEVVKRFPQGSADMAHRLSSRLTSGAAQYAWLTVLEPFLDEAEAAIVKRARNMPVTAKRRKDQATHRVATAFEALVGYWYWADSPRWEEAKGQLFPSLHQAMDDKEVP